MLHAKVENLMGIRALNSVFDVLDRYFAIIFSQKIIDQFFKSVFPPCVFAYVVSVKILICVIMLSTIRLYIVRFYIM